MVVEKVYETKLIMKNLLRLEELLLFALSIYLFNQLSYAGWLYLAWFLAPDISMLGYVASPKVGAWTYNLIHHKGIATAVYLIGAYVGNPALMFAGTLLLGHSAFDRIMGHGLKYEDSFHHTNLGWIGKAQATQ
jgi:hypothetical protein